jgi:hypothetical protein
MSSKQTRRSISVSGDCYDKLKAWCEANGRSMSGICEDEIRKFLDMEPRPDHLARPFGVGTSTEKKTISPKVEVVAPVITEVKEVVPPPSRVETIREVVEAKKPQVSLKDLDAAAKIFTF